METLPELVAKIARALNIPFEQAELIVLSTFLQGASIRDSARLHAALLSQMTNSRARSDRNPSSGAAKYPRTMGR